MDPPRDAWLQEQIDRYRADNSSRAALFQLAATRFAAEQPLATESAQRSRRLRLPGQWLRRILRARRWRGRRGARQSPVLLDGVLMQNQADGSAQTVIVIGVVQQKGGDERDG